MYYIRSRIFIQAILFLLYITAPKGFEIQYSPELYELADDVMAGQVIADHQINNRKSMTLASSSDILYQYTIKMTNFRYSVPYYFAVRGYDEYRYYSNSSSIVHIQFNKVKSPVNLRLAVRSNISKELQLEWKLDSSKDGLSKMQ